MPNYFSFYEFLIVSPFAFLSNVKFLFDNTFEVAFIQRIIEIFVSFFQYNTIMYTITPTFVVRFTQNLWHFKIIRRPFHICRSARNCYGFSAIQSCDNGSERHSYAFKQFARTSSTQSKSICSAFI